MLTVKIINNQATLNNFFYVDSISYVAGIAFSIPFEIFDDETKLRLIPATTATMTCVFAKSDGTTLTLPATMVFNPDDRSIWTVSISAPNSLLIVGGNFEVILDFLGDGTDIRVGFAQNVLDKITLDGEC